MVMIHGLLSDPSQEQMIELFKRSISFTYEDLCITNTSKLPRTTRRSRGALPFVPVVL